MRSPARHSLVLAAAAMLALGTAACGVGGAAAPSAATSAEPGTGSAPASSTAAATPTTDAASSTSSSAAPTEDASAIPAASGAPALILQSFRDGTAAPAVDGAGQWQIPSQQLAELLDRSAGEAGSGEAALTGAVCRGDLSSAAGSSVICEATLELDGTTGQSAWTAYPVAGPNGFDIEGVPGVLFVQGEEPLSAASAELLTADGSYVTGIGRGTAFLIDPLSAEDTATAVEQLFASEDAIYPVDAPIEAVTCEEGLSSASMDPVSCTGSTSGEIVEISVFPARFFGSDSGLLTVHRFPGAGG